MSAKDEMKKLLNDERSEGPAPTDEGVAKFFTDIGKELKHQAEFGAHEMAAALFRGDAFVMYPKTGQEGIEQDNSVHGPAAGEVKPPEPEQQFGDMEM